MLSVSVLGTAPAAPVTSRVTDMSIGGVKYPKVTLYSNGNMSWHASFRTPAGKSGWKELRKVVPKNVGDAFEESQSHLRILANSYMSGGIGEKLGDLMRGKKPVKQIDSKNAAYFDFLIKDGDNDFSHLDKATHVLVRIQNHADDSDDCSGFSLCQISSAGSAVVDAGKYLVDKAGDAAGKVKEGVEWYYDKLCNLVSDPKTQTATAVAATADPAATTPVGQGAKASQGANVVCGIIGKGNAGAPASVPTGATAGTKPTVPASAAPAKYKGGIAAFDSKLGRYQIAMPITGLSGLGDFAAAAPFAVVGTDTSPQAATVVPLAELEKQTGTTPFFKRTSTWIGVGVAVAAVGGGAMYLRRRGGRRR